MTVIEVTPVNDLIESEDTEISHFVCCRDENLALCGIKITLEEWISHEDVTCNVCKELEPSDEFCPQGVLCSIAQGMVE